MSRARARAPRRKPVPAEVRHLLTLGATSPASSLDVRLLRWAQGSPLIDIRRYVETASYSGATRKGITMTKQEFLNLVGHAPEILAAYDQAEGDQPDANV